LLDYAGILPTIEARGAYFTYQYLGINAFINVLLQNPVLQYLYKAYNASEAPAELPPLEALGVGYNLATLSNNS